MTYKDELLEKLRRNTHEQYPMPDTPIDGISYDDTVKQFVDMSMSVGSKVVMAKPNEKLDDIVRNTYPQAKTIASNIAELTIATINPDTVAEAQDLNGTDVGVVYGQIGVAENGCVWIHEGESSMLHQRISGHRPPEERHREQHARGIRPHLHARNRNRHIHLWTIKDCRHRAGAGDGSAGCTRRDSGNKRRIMRM